LGLGEALKGAITRFMSRGRYDKEVLEELGLNPETVVAVRGEELLTPDERVGEGETIEVLSAISGG